MKTSINFRNVNPNSEEHNFRKKIYKYLRKELTAKNLYWIEEKIADRREKIENYCKKKSGRKLQKNAMPIREAVVVIKEETTMLELQNLSKRLEEELNIRVFQIAIHKDEGHYDKETKEWKPNYHAHLVADWQDLNTGKTLKHKNLDYVKMQDLAAECLGMERGERGSTKARLEAIEYKIKMKEEELQLLEEKISNYQLENQELSPDDLVIKESNFFGQQKIKIDETVDNFQEILKKYSASLKRKSSESEIKEKSIKKLQNQIIELKKKLFTEAFNRSKLLTNLIYFDAEKDKYISTLIYALEKKIKSEILKNPLKDRSETTVNTKELIAILNAYREEESLPKSALYEVFKDLDTQKKFHKILSDHWEQVLILKKEQDQKNQIKNRGKSNGL